MNNLNLLELLDSKRVLFYGESSNLEEMNERFQRVSTTEEELENIDYDEFKGVMKYCQASIELYSYFQDKENTEIINKHQEYQTLMETVSYFLVFPL